MKISPVDRKFLTQIFISELRDAYVHLDGRQVLKYFYIFSSGVELIKKNNITYKHEPIGPFLGWMISLIKGQPAPSMSSDPFISIRFTGEHLDLLVIESRSNNIAWDAAAELARLLLKQNGVIPELIIPYLTNEGIRRPLTNRGRHSMENRHRDVCIIMLLSAALKAGYGSITRNDEPVNGIKDSLCDIMQEALISIREPQTPCTVILNKSYAAIKSIWLKRKQLVEFLPIFRLSIENETNKLVCYIGYANKNLANPNKPLESQPCWTLKKIHFEKPFSFFLRLNEGTIIDIGNASAFINPCKKQFSISKKKKRLSKKIEIFAKKNNVIY